MIVYSQVMMHELKPDVWFLLHDELSFNEDSGMKDRLNGFEGDPTKTFVILAKDRREIIGWSYAEMLGYKSGKCEVGVFVLPEYRKQKMGSELIQRAMRASNSSNARCSMHDEASNKFYETAFGAVDGEFSLLDNRGVSSI